MKIAWYEPLFFLFFGAFHLHRVWGLADRESYAAFWLAVQGSYFVANLLAERRRPARGDDRRLESA